MQRHLPSTKANPPGEQHPLIRKMSWRPRPASIIAYQSPRYDQQNLRALLEDFPNIKFVFIQWIDFLGQLRTRCLPINHFTKLIQSGDAFAISTGNLGTLQNDHMSPACNPVGSIFVEPDVYLDSMRPMQSHGPVQDAATVMAGFVDGEGNRLKLCPRSALQTTVDTFNNEHRVWFLVGFEIEITFCKRQESDSGYEFQPMDTIHAWSTFSHEQYMDGMPLMLSITSALKEIGIDVAQVHSEAGAGQYEFVLPPSPPVHAVDTLYQARQCIMQIAAAHGLRATCYAQPFPGIGTASHAHISFNSTSRRTEDLEERFQPHFIAGVLEHLPSLCTFTMPQGVSYNRVLDDSWTSGTWIGWGTQNREVPVRKSGQLRWELRCLDGLANMYLALHAVLSAGLRGVREGVPLTMGDCLRNPSQLSDEEREGLGIFKKLPASIDAAISAAVVDIELENIMSEGILKHYLTMKREEQNMLGEMSDGERRTWLMERY